MSKGPIQDFCDIAERTKEDLVRETHFGRGSSSPVYQDTYPGRPFLTSGGQVPVVGGRYLHLEGRVRFGSPHDRSPSILPRFNGWNEISSLLSSDTTSNSIVSSILVGDVMDPYT